MVTIELNVVLQLVFHSAALYRENSARCSLEIHIWDFDLCDDLE